MKEALVNCAIALVIIGWVPCIVLPGVTAWVSRVLKAHAAALHAAYIKLDIAVETYKRTFRRVYRAPVKTYSGAKLAVNR